MQGILSRSAAEWEIWLYSIWTFLRVIVFRYLTEQLQTMQIPAYLHTRNGFNDHFLTAQVLPLFLAYLLQTRVSVGQMKMVTVCFPVTCL